MSKGFVTLPVGYTRVDAEPLESNTLFATKDSADTYASSDPTAYIGQVVSVTEGDSKLYIINSERKLTQLLTFDKQFSKTFEDTESLQIEHNLGYFPEVILLNNDKVRLYPLVEYLDENTISVKWNGNLSGIVYLR